jgi:hypothetical protein
MSRIDLSFEQRHLLEKLKDWVYAEYIRDLEDELDMEVKVNGLDSTIRRYKMEIEGILIYGWYSESDKEWLNELRERFLKKSLDIHLVDGIWI